MINLSKALGIFRDIPWYEDYQINWETNEVKSVRSWRYKNLWEKILKWWLTKWGHLFVILTKNWIQKTFWIHRLVMLIKTWHLAPEWMEVCHNDGNPQNNHPDNLRYDTHSENMKDKFKHWYKNHFQINPPWLGKFWKDNHLSKVVLQFTKEMVFIKEWESMGCVERELWINKGSIANCCTWKLHHWTAGWFIWRFA